MVVFENGGYIVEVVVGNVVGNGGKDGMAEGNGSIMVVVEEKPGE
jgi:hypothetical protein